MLGPSHARIRRNFAKNSHGPKVDFSLKSQQEWCLLTPFQATKIVKFIRSKVDQKAQKRMLVPSHARIRRNFAKNSHGPKVDFSLKSQQERCLLTPFQEEKSRKIHVTQSGPKCSETH